MRNKILMWALALVAVVWTSCSESTDGPTVVPPSWKGFNYVVKRPVQGGGADEYEQLERGAIQPGDKIKVYAVRKNEGKNVGKLGGKIHVRCTILYKDGMLVEFKRAIHAKPSCHAELSHASRSQAGRNMNQIGG